LSNRTRIAAAVRLAAAAWLVAAGGLACAQEQAAPPPKDTIFARKILMNAVDANMDEIETMLAPGGKLDSAEAREHSDAISTLLLAFPHLFPAATNLWKPNVERDPATDTYASPELWTHFADFYQRATDASKLAYQASRAQSGSEYRGAIAKLRTACNGCHAAYQRTD
jgi:cytochrome c556